MYFNVKTTILKEGVRKPDKMMFLVCAFTYSEVEEVITEKANTFGKLWSIDTISKTSIVNVIHNEKGGHTYYKVKTLFGLEKPLKEEYVILASSVAEAEELVKADLGCDEIISVVGTEIVEIYE